MNEGSDVTNVTEGENRSLLADLAPEGPSTCKPTLSPEIARFLEGETFLAVNCWLIKGYSFKVTCLRQALGLGIPCACNVLSEVSRETIEVL